MQPMLATPGSLPDGPEWLFEVKWDGVRVLADVRTDEGTARLRLTTADGRDVTAQFPELGDLAAALPDVLLDGEIVLLERGVPSFAALGERFYGPVARESARPVTFMAFDVLRLYGVDLLDRPLRERRATLERLDLQSASAVAVSPAYTDGPALLEAAAAQGMEGVVAKRRADPYRPGERSAGWRTVALRTTTTCVVGGWQVERGRIAALLLGVPDEAGALRYVGRMHDGLAEPAVQRLLGSRLVAARQSPFRDPPPRADTVGARWSVPGFVVEVAHLGLLPDGRWRGLVLRAARDDLASERAPHR